MNFRAVYSLYRFEMARMWRTLGQSIASPVISTSLYFIVFGSAIGSSIEEIDGIAYGSFIVPGLIMLSILTHSLSNASFGIYFPKFTGTIYEILSAPMSTFDIVCGYVGATMSKSLILGILILFTATFFVEFHIMHPLIMILFLILTALPLAFLVLSLVFGQMILKNYKSRHYWLLPVIVLGGSFYSIKMLPPFWQSVSLFNPVVYLISGFRWSFYGQADIPIWISLVMIFIFLCCGILIVSYLFRTGYKLKP